MDIKRLFQIPLIFLLIPLFFLVMLIKIYILQYIIINRIAVWGGSFWMVLFSFACLRWKYSPCGRLLCTITVGKSGKNSSLRLTAGEISWCSIKP